MKNMKYYRLLYIAGLIFILGSGVELFADAKTYTFLSAGSVNLTDVLGTDKPNAGDTWTVTGFTSGTSTLVINEPSTSDAITLANGGGTLTININSGITLTVNGIATLSNTVTINGPGTLAVQSFFGNPTVGTNLNVSITNAGPVTLPTTVTNIANFTKNGAGVLTVGHNLNCTGTLAINAGTYLATATATNCGALSLNGTLTATGQDINIIGALSSSEASTLSCKTLSCTSSSGTNNIDFTFTPAGDYTIPSNITLFKSLTLNATGAATISMPNANISITNALTTNGSTKLNFTCSTTRNLTLGSATIGAEIIKSGAGTLNASASLKGKAITINAGRLSYASNIDFGVNPITINGGNLYVTGNLTCGAAVTLASSTTITSTGTTSITTLTGSASASNVICDYLTTPITINNPQNINFTFNDIPATYDLPFSTCNNLTLNAVNPSTITLLDANTSFLHAIIKSGSTISWKISATGTQTFNAPSSTFAVFTKEGAGALNITSTAPTTFTNMTVTAGTLTVSENTNFGTMTLNAGTLTIADNTNITGVLSTAGGTTLTADMSTKPVTLTLGANPNLAGNFTTTGGNNFTITATSRTITSTGDFTLTPASGNTFTITCSTLSKTGGNFVYTGNTGNEWLDLNCSYSQTSGNFTYTGGAGNDRFDCYNFTYNNTSGTFSYDGEAGTDDFTASNNVTVTTQSGAGKLSIANTDFQTGGTRYIYLTANGTNGNNIAINNSTLAGQDIQLTGEATLTCPVNLNASRDLTFNSTVTNNYSGACDIRYEGDEIIIPAGTTINYQAGGTAGYNLNVYTDNLTIEGTLDINSQVAGTLNLKAENGTDILPLININNSGILNINSASADIAVVAGIINLNNNNSHLNLLTTTNKVTLTANTLNINSGTFDAYNGVAGNSETIVNTLLTVANNANAVLDLTGGASAGEIARLTLNGGATFGSAATVSTDKTDGSGDGIDDAGTYIYIDKGATSEITLHPDMDKIFRLYVFSANGVRMSDNIIIGEFDLDENDTDGNEGLFILNGHTFQLNKYLDGGNDLGIINARGSALDLTAIWDNVNMGPSEITFLSDANTDLLIENIDNSNATEYVITLPALSEIGNFRTSLADNSVGNVKLVLSSDLLVYHDFFTENKDDDLQKFEIDLNGFKLTVKEGFSSERDLNNPNSITTITAWETATHSGTFCGLELHGDVDFTNFLFNVGACASTADAFDLTLIEWGAIDSVLNFTTATKFIRHIYMDRALPTLKIADPTIASLTIRAGHVEFFDDGGGAGIDYTVEGNVLINDGGFLRIGDQNTTNAEPTKAVLCINAGASFTGTGVFQAMGYDGAVELTFGSLTAEHSGMVDFSGTWYSDDAVALTLATKTALSNQTLYLHSQAKDFKSITILNDDEGSGNYFSVRQTGDINLAESLILGDNNVAHTGTIQFTLYGKKLSMLGAYDDFAQSLLDASNSVIDFGAACNTLEGQMRFDKGTTAIFRGLVTIDANDEVWTLNNLHLYNNANNNGGGKLTLANDLIVHKNLIITADGEGDNDDSNLTTKGFDMTIYGSMVLGPPWETGDTSLFDTAKDGTKYTTLKLYGPFDGGYYPGMFNNSADLILQILE